MKKFLKDIKRYWPYTYYSAKCDLKSEVASSYLNWLWWILDPLFYMMVYIFIALVVFNRTEPYFPVYVFLGLTVWNYFSKNATASVTLVRSNKAIVTKVYIPRYMLILQRMSVNFFKMAISFVLVVILMIIYRVPVSLYILYFFPILVILELITFGVCTILLHYGVFLDDLSNITTVLLRLLMYLSGIFYSVRTRVPQPYNKYLLYGNPVAFCMDAMRETVLYGRLPDLKAMAVWVILGLILSAIGVRLIYRYENTYAKVM
jgi:teichoic acid transport system permease protein